MHVLGASGRFWARAVAGLALIALASLQPAAARASVAEPWLTTSGTAFVDAEGNPVLLRGVNVVPGTWQPVVSAHANFARIFIPWSTVEPTAPSGGVHTWSASALAAIDSAVSNLQANGIAVEIDFHQCGWSPYFASANGGGCSSGVPAWYYADGRFPATSQGESDAEAAFWTTESGSSEAAYDAFAQMMVERYSAYPAVIGYGIFNEPHAGSLGATTAATNTILRWQADVAGAIRAVDPLRTLFFMCREGGEGVGTADLSILSGLGSVALDFHDYFNGIPNYGLDAAGDLWSPSWAATHNQKSTAYNGTEAAQEAVLDVVLTRTQAAGIPLLMGEWGVRKDDSGYAAYQSQVLDLLTTYRIAAARWDIGTSDLFALRNSNGSFNAPGLQLQAAFAAQPPTESPPATAIAPRIAGTPSAGQTLTAFPGVWTNAPESFRYQWQRCTPGCDPILGSTGQTYAVTPADEDVQLAVSVTAQNAAGTGTASAFAAAAVPPPIGVTPPAISGTPAVGATLTADAGTWDGDPTSFQFQWLHCSTNCTPIAGATSSAYTATASDRGAALAVTVTAANGGGSASQTSTPTAVVVGVPKNTSKPTISGRAKVGVKLTAKPGTWTDTPTAYTYQWQRCSSNGCTDIPGATASTYTLTRSDKGHPVRVAVTATNAAGSATTTSAKTATVTT
jgi:Cellulase (glycosyl hydrolase family 5)